MCHCHRLDKYQEMNLLLIFFGSFGLCTAGKILYLAPIPSKSHFILSERLLEELSDRGHEVFVISPFKRSNPVENINEIVIPDVSESLIDENLANTSDKAFQLRVKISSLLSSFEATKILMENALTHGPVVDMLNSGKHFDLVVGICNGAEALLAGFSHRLKAPMVAISTFAPSASIIEMLGNPVLPSYFSDEKTTDEMTFYERLVNFLHLAYKQIALRVFYLPKQNSLLKKYFGEDTPALETLISNQSLLLINHHFGMNSPRPYLPNIIEIGGYHVRPAKPLPEDLETFVDEAKDGVIYFSMGSSLKNIESRAGKFGEIFKVFSNLTQRILWKYDGEDLPDSLDNVRISKWLPQSDILAHPNLKLFITHGGLLGLTESIYRGVPILGLPIYPDQRLNVELVENLKLGLKVDFDAVDEETLSSAVREILDDPTYSENARLRSRILQDRPLPPIDSAVYWLEYAMRFEGAPHLRSKARHLAWYQMYLIDVFLFIGLLAFALIFGVGKILLWLFRLLRYAMNENLVLKKND